MLDKLSPAAIAAAEWFGSLLPDKSWAEVRRVAFERAIAEIVEARLNEFGECWLTVRGEPDELVQRALVTAGFVLGRDPVAARPLLPRVHLRVRRELLRPMIEGRWLRPRKIVDSGDETA